MIISPTLAYSLQIERLPRGGYLVLEPNQAGNSFSPLFLAAFSDIAEALKFIAANIQPNAAQEVEEHPQ